MNTHVSLYLYIPHYGNSLYCLFIPVTKIPKELKLQKLPLTITQEASPPTKQPTTKEMTLPTVKKIQDDTRYLVTMHLQWYMKDCICYNCVS